MPLPKLGDTQVAWVVEQVVEYIDRQRQIYRGKAVPLSPNQIAAMQPFFPASTLDNGNKFVLSEPVDKNKSFTIVLNWTAGLKH